MIMSMYFGPYEIRQKDDLEDFVFIVNRNGESIVLSEEKFVKFLDKLWVKP